MENLSLSEKIERLNALRKIATDPFIRATRLNDKEVEAVFKNEEFTPHTDELAKFMLMSWQRMELSESIIVDLVEMINNKG